MPAITVAIPAYKPQFLAQAIESVLAQTFGDFELLISDDRGDGSIAEIVSRYGDDRIRLLAGPRQGLVPNSAFLWDSASTDLLKFLYDDDLLAPQALAALHEAIERRSDFTYAFCRRVIIDAEGAEIERRAGFQGDSWMWFEPRHIPNAIMRPIFNMIGEPSSVLIRRSAFGGASCLTQFAGIPVRHLIDVTFYMNAALVGPCVAVPEYLAAFRKHPEQVSSRRQSPAYSAGLYEWELMLRGGVQLGLLDLDVALDSVDAVETLYVRLGAGFSEIGVFYRRLPQLREMLKAGERNLLTDQFLEDLALANQLIEMRAQAAADARRDL